MNALRHATWVLGFALAACDLVGQPPAHGGQREAIVGGAPTTGDPGVFMLLVRGDNGKDSLCSATLIAPRTLLTAAHCVDPSMLGATSLTIVATNVPTQSEVQPGVNTVRVIETRLHPAWNGAAGLSADLALALLETPAQAAPRPWNPLTLAGQGGATVRAVGYGASSPDGGAGIKRTVDLEIRQLSPELISLGNLLDKGICHGDSGGPTFHTFGDGVERLIGVHSFTRTEDCLDGADTRVDAYAPFLLQWLSEREDGCGANLICAVGACASPDPDCVAVGSTCQSAWECRERTCVADAQHPGSYCSRACATDGDCGPGLSCDAGRGLCQLLQLPPARQGEPCIPGATFCTGGAVCSGASAELARCSKPCAQTRDCNSGQRCLTGFAGGNVCVDPPPIVMQLLRAELPAARGCSSGLGLWPGLCVLALLRRRRAALG